MSPTATAGDVLDGIGFPTKRDEAWRYAPHRQLSELTFGPGDASSAPVELDGLVPVIDGPLVVVVNGVVNDELSSFSPSREQLHLSGVEVFTRTVDRGGEHVADAFTALNVAYATEAVVIRIEPGVQIDAPIHIVDVAVPGAVSNTSSSAW